MNTATKIEPQTSAITVYIADAQLEPSTAAHLRECFETMFADAERWAAKAKSIVVTDESQKGDMKLARVARLELKEIRVNAEKARKRLKEDSVRQGKAIDGIANVLKALVEPLEAHLLEQETFAERAEAGRKSALKSAREETLRALGTDPSAYANLGETDEDTWASIRDTAQAAKEKRDEDAKQAELVKLEVERVQEEKRQAARAEAAKAEAERVERERLQLEENARLQAEKAAVEESAKTEREEAARQLEAARVEAAAEAERLRAKYEGERQAAEREARRQHEADAAARAAAALAPDREKFAAFAAMLRTLDIGSLTTPKGKAAGLKVAEQLEKMANWVQKTGAAL